MLTIARVRLRIAVAALTAAFVIAGPTALFPRAADRPTVAGPNGAVSAGHPLTSAAAFEVLVKGGNAFDAGIAAMMVGGVVEQDLYSLGGEGLVLVYPQRERKVTSIVGQGWAPKAATIEWYTSRGKNLSGIGLDPAVVPGVVHAALTVLERWGTMTFEQVSLRAIEYAERGFPLRPQDGRRHRRQPQVHRCVARQPAQLAEARWHGLQGRGHDQAAGSRPHLVLDGRGGTQGEEEGSRRRHRRRPRSLLQGRHRPRDGRLPEGARGALGARRLLRVLRQDRAAGDDDLSRLRRLQALVRQPGPGSARGAQHPRAVRPEVDAAQQRPLPAHRRRGAQARLRRSRQLLRRPGIRRESGEGLLSKEYAKERARQIDAQQASKAYLAGDPLRFDSKVKSWNYWIANLPDATQEPQPAKEEDLTAGVVKDTTHISVIDREGNVFDSTPSGAWIPTSPILGRTGIAMSVRGESFWLDPSRADQLRPRSRPRYTLTPTIVLRNGQPFLAIGTPGGDNQEQTILQSFLNIVEFWPERYPISTTPSGGRACRRCTSTDPSGRIPPASTSSMSNRTCPRRSTKSSRRRGTTSARSRR